MTPERRGVLWRRAFSHHVSPWRRRIVGSLIAAVILTAAGMGLFAIVILVATIPTVVRYVRREIALGLLLADAHRYDQSRAAIPATDLRDQK